MTADKSGVRTLTLPGEARPVSEPDVSIHAREVMLQDGWTKMAFIARRLANDPTTWWAINLAGAESQKPADKKHRNP